MGEIVFAADTLDARLFNVPFSISEQSKTEAAEMEEKRISLSRKKHQKKKLNNI